MPVLDDGRMHYPKPLLTGAERSFLNRLQDAVPEHFVFPQVCMGALVDPPGYFHGVQRVRARIPYQSKMVDFVVYDGKKNEVVALVELDDYSHDNEEERDANRDAITAEAGYATVRVDGRRLPDQAALRDLVLRARIRMRKSAKVVHLRSVKSVGVPARWALFWTGLVLSAALLGAFTWVILPAPRAVSPEVLTLTP
jgi:very-short-patch-repair endonuclease